MGPLGSDGGGSGAQAAAIEQVGAISGSGTDTQIAAAIGGFITGLSPVRTCENGKLHFGPSDAGPPDEEATRPRYWDLAPGPRRKNKPESFEAGPHYRQRWPIKYESAS